MPKDKDAEVVDTSAADAAVVEASAKPNDLVEFEFNGATYSFPRKRLRSERFIRPLQEGADIVALRNLLGEAQYDELIRANEDEDGDFDRALFRDVYKAMGDAGGQGKSSSSSRR